MIFHRLDGNIPALNRVALRTVRAHFSLVDVGVAVLAILADVGKYRLDMALHALHFFVHAAKRVLGLIVIELRYRPDGPPTRGGMAVLAGNVQRAVRTTSALPLRPGYRSAGCRPGKKN